MPALSFIVGLAGNVISLLVFASPIETFRAIIKKKSVEDYKAIPYITTLLSTSLWTFYGILKPNGLLIYTINGAGAILEIIYVTLFLVYAPKDKRMSTMKLVAALNVGAFGMVACVVLFALRGTLRLTVVGILCDALNTAMYMSPLAIMFQMLFQKTVIRTKSVNYMPFFLSFFLFINAGVWVFYAALVKDIYIGVPNVLGLFLSSAQLILYAIYFEYKKKLSTKDEEDVEEKGPTSLDTKQDLETQSISPTKDEQTNFCNDLNLPKKSKHMNNMPNENGVKKIEKAMSLSSYELQAIVLSVEDVDNVMKKS